ncbi:MAG: SdrD B-like domain-containing protein, partial [Propionibacteriaceae bacterium]|nr:SdrD B-like domain-containing protein [Propionibacteriaceae bacterium]
MQNLLANGPLLCELTIHVKDPNPQTLPREIRLPNRIKLNILAMNGNRFRLEVPAGGVTLNSPVSLRNANLELGDAAIVANDSFEVDNLVVKGNPGSSLAMLQGGNTTPPKLKVTRSSFHDAAIVRTKQGWNGSVAIDSVEVQSPGSALPAVDLQPVSGEVEASTITRARFTTYSPDEEALISIASPNVRLTENTFVLFSKDKPTVAVKLVNADGVDGLRGLHGIRLEKNTFAAPVALDYERLTPGKAPGEAAVVFTRNNFSTAGVPGLKNAVLPRGKVQEPSETFQGACNYWDPEGMKDRWRVNAAQLNRVLSLNHSGSELTAWECVETPVDYPEEVKASLETTVAPAAPTTQVNRPGQDKNEPMGWRVRVVSSAAEGTIPARGVDVIDRLPKQGQDGTAFVGDHSFLSAKVVAGGPQVRLLYTSAENVNADPTAASNTAGGGTAWCDAPAGGTLVSGTGECPSEANLVTGVRAQHQGELAAGEELIFEIMTVGTGNAAGNTYHSVVGTHAEPLLSQVPPVSATQQAKAADVGGLAWLDENRNGIRDEIDGVLEPPVAGITVELTGVDDLGNPVTAEAITDPTGRYSFDGLRNPDDAGYMIFFAPREGGFTSQNSSQGAEIDSQVDARGATEGIKPAGPTSSVNAGYLPPQDPDFPSEPGPGLPDDSTPTPE